MNWCGYVILALKFCTTGGQLGPCRAFQLLTYQQTPWNLFWKLMNHKICYLFWAKVRVTSDSSEAISAAPGWVFKESLLSHQTCGELFVGLFWWKLLSKTTMYWNPEELIRHDKIGIGLLTWTLLCRGTYEFGSDFFVVDPTPVFSVYYGDDSQGFWKKSIHYLEPMTFGDNSFGIVSCCFHVGYCQWWWWWWWLLLLLLLLLSPFLSLFLLLFF